MKKLKKLPSLIQTIKKLKRQGKRLGLITGCFDILHTGHVELLRFAKKHTDVLIIGLENDETIRLSKGSGRPIHNFTQRSNVLSELASVDYIFEIPIRVRFALSEEIKNQYVKLTMKIKPDYLITTKSADKYWQQKKTGAKEIGVKLLVFNGHTDISTSLITQKLQREL